MIEFFNENFGIKITNAEKKIENIIKTTGFNYMKNMEAKNSFDEAMPWSSFFREGKKEQWKNILEKDQRKKIEENFKKYMINFDYY